MSNSYLNDDGCFYDTDLVLEGEFEDSVSKMLNRLWGNGVNVLEILRGNKFLDKMYREMPLFQDSDTNTPDTTTNSKFFTTMMSSNSDISNGPYTLISLYHKAGRIDGTDIIYSTILKLIESSTKELKLVFGYFQLFPHFEKALESAIARGVKVKLFTNSTKTASLAFLSSLFAKAQTRLLEMGAEVYTLDEENNRAKSNEKYLYQCAHNKFMTVDDKVLLCGSWNCIGSSVFHDSEFAMILFEDEECQGLCEPFNLYLESSLQNGIYRKLEDETITGTLNPFAPIFMTKQALQITRRGY